MVNGRGAAQVLNIAHRGASGHSPEHTIAAYDLALEMGADFIEHDLRLSADGGFVAMHDASLERTTGRADMVRDLTLEELKALDAGGWFNRAHPDEARSEYTGLRIPTMDELFARYGAATKYYVEVKDPHLQPGVEKRFVELLRTSEMLKHALAGGVVIQSFDPESLFRFRSVEPDLVLVRLFSLIQGKEIMLQELASVATYAAGIGPDKFNIDEELVACAHDHGLYVHPFTADERSEMIALLRAGVDGMFTNFPDRLAGLQSDGKG